MCIVRCYQICHANEIVTVLDMHEWASIHVHRSKCVCACACVYVYMCVYVYVCVCLRTCVCTVCVFVGVYKSKLHA